MTALYMIMSFIRRMVGGKMASAMMPEQSGRGCFQTRRSSGGARRSRHQANPARRLLIPVSCSGAGSRSFGRNPCSVAAPFPFALFGVPFVWSAVPDRRRRFLFDSWLRQRMMYVLTDRRVLITRSGPWPHFTAVNLDMLRKRALKRSRMGEGRSVSGGLPQYFPSMRAGFGSWTRHGSSASVLRGR